MIRGLKKNIIKILAVFLIVLLVLRYNYKRSDVNQDTNDGDKDNNVIKIRSADGISDIELKKFPVLMNKTRNLLRDSQFQTQVPNDLKNNGNSKYIQEISADRINRLFNILLDKETRFEKAFKELDVLLFKNLINKNPMPAFKNFTEEIDKYLTVTDNRVTVTDEFVKYLNDLSDEHSFRNPRDRLDVAPLKEGETKPVIVTAANSGYYNAMQATIFHIHKQFPDYPLIIYDLGLTPSMIETTMKNCKCEIVKFDPNGLFKTVSDHIGNLKSYSWKPILIQETLKRYDTVFYVDSSIRFHSGDLSPIVNSLKKTSMLTQFIGLDLVCYTNPRMFEWFGETKASYEQFYTIEANILLFHKNFLTLLIMKAWVTCAFDSDCIAPPGSSVAGCCGCHRYDQDAITIVDSFFYGHPKDRANKLPAYSFTKKESYFFEVRRYEGMNYFKES